jgi:hypothetical protein
MRCLRLIVVLACSLLAACATTHSYYKPIGPGSYFKACGGGPDHNLGFEVVDGLAVMISTGMREYKPIPADQLDSIWISFRVKRGHTLQIPSGIFRVTQSDSNASEPITVTEIFRVDYVQLLDESWERKSLKLPISTELNGGVLLKDFLRSEFNGWFPYELELTLNQRAGKSFSVEVPRVLFDGRPVQIPAIRVDYGTYTHVRTLC